MKKVIEWEDNNLFIKHWVEQNEKGEFIMFREIDKDYYKGKDTIELEGNWSNDLNVGKEIDSVVAEMYDSCDNILYCEKELCKILLQHNEIIETDFLKTALDEYGYKNLKDIYAGKAPRYFFDMDGTLFEWNNVTYYERLYEEGYFLNLDPNMDLINTMNVLIEESPDQVFIASKYLTDSKYAYSEKMSVIQKYLPNLKKDNIILIPNDEQKVNYIPGGINITDILIDDYTINLLEWNAAGGEGIKYLNGINNTRASWVGANIQHDDPKQLEKIKEVINQPLEQKIESKQEEFELEL